MKRSPTNRACGIDFDQPTLDWGAAHNLAYLPDQATQPELICADVLEAKTKPADLLFALNFSYCIFKTREQLKAYFKKAKVGLKQDGLFVVFSRVNPTPTIWIGPARPKFVMGCIASEPSLVQ